MARDDRSPRQVLTSHLGKLQESLAAIQLEHSHATDTRQALRARMDIIEANILATEECIATLPPEMP